MGNALFQTQTRVEDGSLYMMHNLFPSTEEGNLQLPLAAANKEVMTWQLLVGKQKFPDQLYLAYEPKQ